MITDICNFGRHDVPFSVAEYSIVDGILNMNCGDLGGWVQFPDWLLWYVCHFVSCSIRWHWIDH